MWNEWDRKKKINISVIANQFSCIFVDIYQNHITPKFSHESYHYCRGGVNLSVFDFIDTS